MKNILLLLIMLALIISSCGRPLYTLEECKGFQSLRNPEMRKGYIDYDLDGQIVFERKWRSYKGLSKECILELLGEPHAIEKNTFTYYVAYEGGTIGLIRFHFRWNRLKRFSIALI